MEQPATFWMMEPLRKYATLSGRARRAEHWWFYLFYALVTIASTVIDSVTGSPFAGYLVTLAFLLPTIAVGVRRLHDVDQTGWWIMSPALGLIPLALAFIMGLPDLFNMPSAADTSDVRDVLVGIGALMLLGIAILLLVWFCSRGTEGPNRFGPDPLDRTGGPAELFS